MSAKELATKACSFKFEDPMHTGLITPTFVSSAKVKCGGVNCFTSAVLTCSNCSNGTTTLGTGIGIMVGDSIKVKTFGLSFCRKDTKVTGVVITGVTGSTPSTYTTNILVDSPGQTKVKVI